MALTLITPPTAPVVTLAEMKAYLHVDHDDEDTTITALVQAVTQHLEGRDGWLGRALMTQTWDLTIDQFPARELRIPLPPLQQVVFVNYYDTNGIEQTFSSMDYTVDLASVPGWVVLNASSRWPTTLPGINMVRVRFVCGYADDGNSPPNNVPAPIKVAIVRMVASHFDTREAVIVGQTAMKVPGAAEALLAPYRTWKW
jgi:uncharacterized phiE125 gp8 family phage protein